MTMFRNAQLLAAAAVAAVSASAVGATNARADAPAFAYSFNLGGFSDYRFRGISQTAEEAAIQGGVDLTYGIGYFGVWASNLDFGRTADTNRDIANGEIDIYAGIKPVLGPVTFDLGVLYYAYPKGRDTLNGLNTNAVGELNYLELKLGASATPVENLAVGATFFYSPDYTLETGTVYTLEGTAGYTLPKVGVFVPTIGGRLGYQVGTDNRYDKVVQIANGEDSYLYWDVGLTLAVEKIAFDFRYIDTDIKNNNAAGGGVNGFCKGPVAQCDSTFVASVKITLP